MKNPRYLYTYLNTQWNELRDINREYTLFTALLSAHGKQQAKFIYGMGIGTARIVQTYTIAKKIPALYGEVGPSIGPSQTLVLYKAVHNTVMVKNLTPEEIHTGFANGNVVD